MSAAITKAERAELRAIVRGQFKVLRAELKQREAEMKESVEEQVTERYATEDHNWADLQHAVYEVQMDANRQVNDLLYGAGYQTKGNTERVWVSIAPMTQPQAGRMEIRRHAYSRIASQVKAARLSLDRREADLLRELSVGALETDEAQAFLSAIPSVGELVPETRLAELEASLRGETP